SSGKGRTLPRDWCPAEGFPHVSARQGTQSSARHPLRRPPAGCGHRPGATSSCVVLLKRDPVDLAGAEARKRRFRKDHPCRDLEGSKAASEEIAEFLLTDAAAFAPMQDCDRELAEPVIRSAEHGRFGNAFAAIYGSFYFRGGDILAAPDDDVLLAIDNEQVAVLVDVADVAGLEISIGGKCPGSRLVIFPIAFDVGGRADGNLATLVGGQVPIGFAQDRQFDEWRMR